MKAKVIFGIVILYLSLVVLPKFCYRKTGDFWLQTILSNRPYDSSLDCCTPTPEFLREVNPILSQPFTFLGGGQQSFIFLSADKKFVLKFFKHKFTLLHKGRFKSHLHNPEPVLRCYHIARKAFPSETGIFYSHLTKTEGLHPTVILIDKMGNPHRVALDETEFVLQHRAELIRTHLRNQMESKDIDGAKRSIESVVQAFKTFYEQGMMITDLAFLRSIGFIGEKAFLLDAGSLVKSSKRYTPQQVKRDLLEKGKTLEKWLIDHYPQLYDHYQDRIALEFGGAHVS